MEKEPEGNSVYVVYMCTLYTDSSNLISVHRTREGAEAQCIHLYTPSVREDFNENPFYYEKEPLLK